MSCDTLIDLEKLSDWVSNFKISPIEIDHIVVVYFDTKPAEGIWSKENIEESLKSHVIVIIHLSN